MSEANLFPEPPGDGPEAEEFRKDFLCRTNLSDADLTFADLSQADLTAAVLENALLTRTNFTDATLISCLIYGAATWDLRLDGAKQRDFVVTAPQIPPGPTIAVDNIEIAQFLYLLVNNKNVRNAIDGITSKIVLILGNFSPRRKKVLDALREELQKRRYVPIIFDFEKPESRSRDETITLLARMARFIIADLSDAEGVQHELRSMVPELPSVAVQPLVLRGQAVPSV